MSDAQRAIAMGKKYPYDDGRESIDWAHDAARGVLYDLGDRSGVKHGFLGIDVEIRYELVEALANIIREAERADRSATRDKPNGL